MILPEIEISCPYCGEIFGTLVDCTSGSQSYYEDCQICCSPILFFLEVRPDGSLLAVNVKRDDE
ncbi:MAG: CPXCG motif-containing cysteine-rich protein [Methylococcales bacterium]